MGENKEVKMPAMIFRLLFLYVIVFIAGAIFTVNKLFSKDEFWDSFGLLYQICAYFFTIIAASLIVVTLSKHQAGWNIVLISGIGLIVSGLISVFYNMMLALILMLNGVYIVFHILLPGSRTYFKSQKSE